MMNQTGNQKKISGLLLELQKERDTLDIIMENTNTQIAYIDNHFNFIKVNSAYADSSGRKREELVGENHFNLFPNSENQKIFEMARDSGQPIEYTAKPFEFEDQPKRGITYWDWMLSPVKDHFGDVKGLVLSLNEVTDNYRRLTQTKRSALKLLAITSSAVFIAEAAIMGAISLFPDISPLIMAIIDATALTLIVFPLLYFILLKPLIVNISERKRAQHSLKNAYDKMKVAIEDRTSELANSNIKLKKEIENHHLTQQQLQVELEKTKKGEKEVVSLLNAAQSVLAEDKFDIISKDICVQCKQIIGTDTGYIALLSDNKAEYEIKFIDSTGECKTNYPDKKIPLSGLPEKVYKSNKAIFDNNLGEDNISCFFPPGYKKVDNVLYAPLFINKDVIGFMGLSNKTGGFTENDNRLATAFAELIAIALAKSITLESLENSESRFRSVAETAGEAIINVDQEGQIIFWNKAAHSIFGYSKKEIFKKPLTLLIPEKYRNDHLKGMRNVVSGGKPSLIGKSFEMTGLRKNGEEFPIDLSLSMWEMGEEKYFTGIIRDITRRKELRLELENAKDVLEIRINERTTELIEINEKLRNEILERKKIEKEIEHERKRLFSVLDELPASVHLLRQDHSIVFANRYFRQHFGDDLQKPCHKILHGEDNKCSVCNAFDVFKSGIAGEYEEEHSDGRLYRVYNYPFTDTDKSTLILQLGIDITDHKKAEEALRKSEERFRVLVNSIDDTVFTLDRKQRFLEIYGSLFDRLGITAKNTLNKSLSNIFDKETYQHHNLEIQKAMTGENVMYEWIVSKEDETRFIQNSISPIFDHLGNTDGVVGVARDVTMQKNLEKQLVDTEKLLTVAEMSAMISHEFRNSLTSVRMILELQLESDNLEKAEKNSLSVALSSVNHMEEVVSQLLNFSRPRPMVFKAENLKDIVLKSVKFTELHLQKNQITLDTQIKQEFPSLKIDKDYMKEALINLILNAIQAISRKSNSLQIRKINICLEEHVLKKALRELSVSEIIESNGIKNKTDRIPELILEQGEKCVLITVRDTGVGIKPENLDRIFNPFYTTVSQGGTGLGLSMVKRTVNAHRGVVRVESEVDKGTVFYIYLPLYI